MAGHNMSPRTVPVKAFTEIPKHKVTEKDVFGEALRKVGLIENESDPRVDGFIVVYKFLRDKYQEDGQFEI